MLIIHSGLPADKTICVTDVPGMYKAGKKEINQDPHIYQLPRKDIYTHYTCTLLYSHSPQKTPQNPKLKKPDNQNNSHAWLVENFPSDTNIFCVLSIPRNLQKSEVFPCRKAEIKGIDLM